MQSITTNLLPLKQSDQLYSKSNEKDPVPEITLFRDIYEYLQALELEASFLFIIPYLRAMRHHRNETENDDIDKICSILQIPKDSATLENIQGKYRKIHEMNRLRESVSRDSNIGLPFYKLCRENNLCDFERNTLSILLMLNFSRQFRKLFQICSYEQHEIGDREDSLKIGTLLMILCDDLRDQTSLRCYFSLDGKLVTEEFIVFLDCLNDTTNVLDVQICIQERIARYIIGDNNFYHQMFAYVSREQGNIRLEQVVLMDSIKNDILTYINNFLKNKNKTSIDEFFGYGTGLVFLFHGPSGTGKTMLAKALANHFNCQIFTIDYFNFNCISASWEKIFSTLVKEAALHNAIVFIDEADKLFGANSDLGRLMLIELEKSRCITIFATNKTDELHPALERRISMKVHFPFPDENARQELWERLIPDSVTCSNDVDLKELARLYRFSGGLIKNTVLLAVNASIGKNSDGKSVLTRSDLIHAADIQCQSMMNDSHICTKYHPQCSIAESSFGAQQKEDLHKIASACEKLKKENWGCNLLVCASHIQAGIEAVEGIAYECGLQLRQFDYYIAMSKEGKNDIYDPISQRKITPLEYAFKETVGGPVMTMIVDYVGEFSSYMEGGVYEGSLRRPYQLIWEMRDHQDLFCLVTHPVKQGNIPVVFNIVLELDYPPEDTQVLCWKQYLMGSRVDDLELRAIVRQYPMHLSEIQMIGRYASIQSVIHSDTDRPLWKNIEEILFRYRRKKNVPLLFGNID